MFFQSQERKEHKWNIRKQLHKSLLLIYAWRVSWKNNTNNFKEGIQEKTCQMLNQNNFKNKHLHNLPFNAPQELGTFFKWNSREYVIWVDSFLIRFQLCKLHVILEPIHILIQTPPTNAAIQCGSSLSLYSLYNSPLCICSKALKNNSKKTALVSKDKVWHHNEENIYTW